MSIAKKCDRCGALYEPYGFKHSKSNGICPVFIGKDASVFYYTEKDLCPECMGEFQRLTDIPTAKVFTIGEIIETIKYCVNQDKLDEKNIVNELYNLRGGMISVG